MPDLLSLAPLLWLSRGTGQRQFLLIMAIDEFRRDESDLERFCCWVRGRIEETRLKQLGRCGIPHALRRRIDYMFDEGAGQTKRLIVLSEIA